MFSKEEYLVLLVGGFNVDLFSMELDKKKWL